MDYTVHGISPGQNTGVGRYSPFQGIFPIQGYNPGLPHCRKILYWLSHKRSPNPKNYLDRKEYKYKELYKKDFNDPDNHNGVITHLEPDILECEVKWALESITYEQR